MDLAVALPKQVLHWPVWPQAQQDWRREPLARLKRRPASAEAPHVTGSPRAEGSDTARSPDALHAASGLFGRHHAAPVTSCNQHSSEFPELMRPQLAYDHGMVDRP